jgi:hypothetical protein
MEFKKFLAEVVLLPCQVVRAGRRLLYHGERTSGDCWITTCAGHHGPDR